MSCLEELFQSFLYSDSRMCPHTYLGCHPGVVCVLIQDEGR